MITWMNLSLIRTLKPDLGWAQPLRPTQSRTRQPGLWQNLLYFSNMPPFIDSLKETFQSLVVHNMRLTIHHRPLPCSLHHFYYHPSSIVIDSSGIIQDSEDDPSCTPMASQANKTPASSESRNQRRSPTLLAWTPKLKPSMHSTLSPQCSRSSSLKEALQATNQN